MPELPEVETIVRYLREGAGGRPALPGRIAATPHVFWERSLAIPGLAEFQQRLPGQRLGEITRRGKFLLLHFERDVLLFHLRMSGDLLTETGSASGRQTPIVEESKSQYKPAHIRCIVDFEDGVRLVFVDPRKFGRLWLVRDAQKVVGGLGPEPLEPAFTAADFFARLSAQRRQLKPLLLDQGFLAGLGNIYTDEALFQAKLHPCQTANMLAFDQAKILLEAIRSVLTKAIAHQGASIDWIYRGGDFQNYIRVYQRTGQPCLNCGTPIERRIIGQRGTHFCPNCQRIVNRP